MSSDTPRPYLQMRTMAEAIKDYLAPFCHRIEIAGSIRRKRVNVSDIELVAVPKMLPNLLGEPTEASEIDNAFDDKPVTFTRRGRKYWKFSFCGTSGEEYTVDLFLQPNPATWGVNFLLRTGSSDFSHRMVTPTNAGGLMPTQYRVSEARVWRSDGIAMETPEEIDVFKLWGMQYIKPQERV
jgi:DNA polymerase/3'-5' exonuclease PolX